MMILNPEDSYNMEAISPLETLANQAMIELAKKINHSPQCSCYNKRARKKGYTCSHYNLEVIHPELMNEWDKDSNTLDPKKVLPSSGLHAWWICEKKHKWMSQISSKVRGAKCPFCKPRSRKVSLSTLTRDKARHWDYSKNRANPENYSIYSRDKIWWVCFCGYSWNETIYAYVKHSSCPACDERAYF
jgi:hypothetical protein